MKKKYIAILTLCSSALFFEGCNHLLEEEIVSGITGDTHFNTAQGIQDGVRGTYSYLREWYGPDEGSFLSIFGTDTYTKGTSGGANRDFNDYNAGLSASKGYLNSVWTELYKGINTANTVIHHLPDNPIAEAEKSILEGEVRALRAFYYWHLVETFGDVHLTLEQTEGVETTAFRHPVSDIYEKAIIPDLEFAIANLPITQSETGRVNKPTAQAMLARFSLSYAWKVSRGEVSGDADALFAKARELANSVINDYSYELIDSWLTLWDYDNQVNEEVIWSVHYNSDELSFPMTNNNWLGTRFTPHYYDHPGLSLSMEYDRDGRRFRPTNYLLQHIYKDVEEIDTRWIDGFRRVWYANNEDLASKGIHIGDTALYIVNYAVDDAVQASKPYTLVDIEPEGYTGNQPTVAAKRWPHMLKHTQLVRPSASSVRGDRDIPIFRLAEMYLIVAEASFKLGDIPAAVDAINTIRRRAALEGHEAEMEISEADIDLDFIIDEWARETHGEYHRWFDLKRTGKLIENVRKWNPDGGPNIQEHHVLRPIPQSQLDRITNPEDFQQNAGY